MAKISIESERKILELHFKGIPRNTIAQTVGTSGSTVSRITSRLPDCLQELRALSFELRKHNLTPAEAKASLVIQTGLHELGISPSKAQAGIVACENICSKARFKPQRAIQAAMQLDKFEKAAGKSYPRALRDFEILNHQTETLKLEKQKVKQENANEKRKHDHLLRRNHTTQKDLQTFLTTKQALQAYDIDLGEPAALKDYLQNMKFSGEDPKKFIEVTRKHGSLEQSLANLKQHTEEAKLVLKDVKEQTQAQEHQIIKNQATITTQQVKMEEHEKTLEAQRQEIVQCKRSCQEEQEKLATILNVRSHAETIQQALTTNTKKLAQLKDSIKEEGESLQEIKEQKSREHYEMQQTQERKSALEQETREILQIKDEATPLQAGVASLRQEFQQMTAQFAFVKVIIDFYTGQPHQLNQLETAIQMIKKAREDPDSPLRQWIPVIEEDHRMRALAVVRPLLTSSLSMENEMLRTELRDKEENARALKTLQEENRFLTTLKATFEGQTIDMAALRNWVITVFNEEIERRAKEKFNILAAMTHGALDWATSKIDERFRGNKS